MTKIVKKLDTNLHGSLQSMICQQVTLSGDAEWPKVVDAVIEAKYMNLVWTDLGYRCSRLQSILAASSPWAVKTKQG
jgi:hypothetical protein